MVDVTDDDDGAEMLDMQYDEPIPSPPIPSSPSQPPAAEAVPAVAEEPQVAIGEPEFYEVEKDDKKLNKNPWEAVARDIRMILQADQAFAKIAAKNRNVVKGEWLYRAVQNLLEMIEQQEKAKYGQTFSGVHHKRGAPKPETDWKEVSETIRSELRYLIQNYPKDFKSKIWDPIVKYVQTHPDLSNPRTLWFDLRNIFVSPSYNDEIVAAMLGHNLTGYGRYHC